MQHSNEMNSTLFYEKEASKQLDNMIVCFEEKQGMDRML